MIIMNLEKKITIFTLYKEWIRQLSSSWINSSLFENKMNRAWTLNKLSSSVISSNLTRVRNKIKRIDFESSILGSITIITTSLAKFLQQLCCIRLLTEKFWRYFRNGHKIFWVKLTSQMTSLKGNLSCWSL